MPEQLFDRHARKYDAWYDTEPGKALFAMEVDCLRPFVDHRRPWLEVGAGSGRFARALGLEYGIDPSRPFLHIAHSRGIKVVQGVGDALPFRSGVFSGVLMALALCFIRRPEKALGEAARVMKDNGCLVLGMIFKESSWAKYYTRLGEEGHPIYRNAVFHSRAELETMLREAGFGELTYRSVLLQPPGLTSYKSELPLEGYRPNAGFVALKTVKK